MESEALHLRDRLDERREHQLAVWRRTRGSIGAVRVEIVVSGIGLINAAAATATLLATCESLPRAVFNYGCSGAHREDIDAGDVIIGDRTVHTSSLIVLPDGIRRSLLFSNDDGARSEDEVLAVDPGLVAVARGVAETVLLPAWPGIGHDPRIFVGPVASADVWTQHGATIRGLHLEHGSLCEEMEAAAIAQVCAKYGVPFLPVKDISNNELQEKTAHTDAGAITLEAVRGELGLRAALLVEATIVGLGSAG
jgi:adenosylhomocysteine nucleosidase